MNLYVLLLFIFLLTVFLYRTYLGAPFVRTNPRRVRQVLELLEVKPGMRVAELGSGDGTLVIPLAKAGAVVHGYENIPWLVWRSRKRIMQANLSHTATIFWKNFWHEGLSRYDAIVVYGVSHIMGRLEKKLLRELKPGTKIISVYFQFPVWKPTSTVGDVRLYVR